jgi:hypothetical protein
MESKYLKLREIQELGDGLEDDRSGGMLSTLSQGPSVM